jgi:CheY-like chemotaxis protein
MNILIIEDEHLIQKYLNKILSNRGHIVESVFSGRKAIDLLMQNDYDRILCDLMLQDVSGFDIIEEAKQQLSIESIRKKFIIMTAYINPAIKDRVQNYGLKLFPKPFSDIEKLISEVESEND